MFLAKVMIASLVDVDIICEFMDANKCGEAAKNLS